MKDPVVCSRYEVAPKACDHGYATKYQKLACGIEGGIDEYRVGTFLSQRVASKEKSELEVSNPSWLSSAEKKDWPWIGVSGI